MKFKFYNKIKKLLIIKQKFNKSKFKIMSKKYKICMINIMKIKLKLKINCNHKSINIIQKNWQFQMK